MSDYRRDKWINYREEVIRLDGYACTMCGKSREDGVVLQVHHKFYDKGKKPWEYDYDACVTVCKKCHAVEHGIIPPDFGWEYCGSDDLGSPDGECDYCGKQIRYIFFITHPSWYSLEVGEQCCDKLTSTMIATELMSAKRLLDERRKRFVSSSKWVVSKVGAGIRRGKFNIRIISGEKFRVVVNGVVGKKLFQTELDAKCFIFDVLESGRLSRWNNLRMRNNLSLFK